MKASDVVRNASTPLGVPTYPARATRFTDREYFNIVYRTDRAALEAIVPEPLVIGEPLVRFEIMKMGDVEGYGPYVECGQAIAVRFGNETGEYLREMHLDSFAATAAGRELSGYPKAAGNPALRVAAGALIGTLDHGGERVATATMAYKWGTMDIEEARRSITTPSFAIKIVPNTYNGSLRVCDLVRAQISDITVKGAWTGPARLQLDHHVLAPLADLPVLEIVSASHIVTDLTLSPMLPVHDYLKGDG